MKFSIESIELLNYRQYKGFHKLKIHYDPKKNVAIVLGKNGSGKSNLLNAITWCLYGVEAHLEKKEYNSSDIPIINSDIVKKLNLGEQTTAEVKITLKTQQGNWIIERNITGFNGPRGFTYQSGCLKVIRNINGEIFTDEGEDTQVLINNLLPEDLRTFFFIDGEQLRGFFKLKSPENVAKAIEQISQLELIKKSDDHFRALKRELRKEVRESTPQLEIIHEKIQFNDDKVKENLASIATLRNLIESWQIELQEIKDFFINSNNGNVRSLTSEREILEDNHHHLKNDLSIINGEKCRFLVNLAPFIYLKKEIMQSKKILDDSIETKSKLHNISRDLIKSIFTEEKCICGKEIDNESKNILRSYCDEIIFSDLRDILISGKNRYDDIQKNVLSFSEKIENFNHKIKDKNTQIESINRRIEYINDILKTTNIDEITKKEIQRDELIKKISNKTQAIKILEQQNQIYEKNNQDLLQEEKKEIFKDQKNEILRKKLEILDDALKVFSKTSEQIKNMVRNHVEETTSKNFFELIRKKEAFKDIKISDRYEVSVQHVSGFDVANNLAAGEQMILSLSFMSALMTISGFKAPVIIDTPLGRIDIEHRNHISSKLPNFVEGTQLMLFVTPTEYDENVKANFSKYLLSDNFYQIKENESSTESVIVS